MRILCCGDREWSNIEVVRKRLSSLPKDTVIIHGACRGADYLCGMIAKDLGFSVEEFPADWRRYGRQAGPIRNRTMLDTGPDLVIAFHNNIEKSKGTANCLLQAGTLGIKYEIVTEVGS